ncbi:MAG: hypothetical protein KBT06_11020 [Prevotellaceae bacterium]|nr:hypothetical protein [Candidatus Colivivens equi]
MKCSECKHKGHCDQTSELYGVPKYNCGCQYFEKKDKCDGCRYENSTDIREHLYYCSYCKRAYDEDELVNIDDKYVRLI